MSLPDNPWRLAMPIRRAREAAALRRAVKTLPRPDMAALRESHAGFLRWAALDHLAENAGILSARRRLSPYQWRIAIYLVAIGVLSLSLAPLSSLVAINMLFICYSGALLALRVWMLARMMRGTRPVTPPPLDTKDLPIVTILLPLYREAASLPYLIASLSRLDYPRQRLDIKLLIETDDPDTLAEANRLCREDHFDIVMVPDSQPRTKPKACNYGLWTARGTLTVIYDAEDRPEPDQLRKAAAAFAAATDDTRAPLACVQARLNYYNRHQNWLTRLFAMEYALLFDVVLPGLDRLGAPIPLGGTSNFFLTKTLIELGGWDPHNVTEDADLGLRLTATGHRTAMIDSTTYEEAVARPRAWIRQRSRWVKGFIQTWFVHTRAGARRPLAPFSREAMLRRLTLHLVIGGVVISAVVNPLFWALYIAWIAGWGGIAALFPTPLLELSVLGLLAGNGFFAYLTMIAPARRRWYDQCGHILMLPVVWLMLSAAGYVALWQFLRKPFYWEKTEHAALGLPDEA